jgi:geranylgeranyl diphosphate synthase, type I
VSRLAPTLEEGTSAQKVSTYKTLMHERAEQVFAVIEDLVETLPVPPTHRKLLRVHLSVGRDMVDANPDLPSIQLPLLVHEAITGDDRTALPVAAACTLLYLGADLFDNVADRELPEHWHTHDPAEANLAAATLLATLPQLSVARLQEQGVPPARLWALAHLFAETLLTMSAGQHEDLLFPQADEDVTLEACRGMVERKSGSEFALFAKTGAMLASADPCVTESYGAFGLCLGTAGQIASDLRDIWNGGMSQDLTNGKRTLPIVFALSTLQEEPRERLRQLLGAAREETERHDEVRERLFAAGSVHYTALMVEVYRRQAHKHLAAASPREPAGRDLRTMLDRVSLLPGDGLAGAYPGG